MSTFVATGHDPYPDRSHKDPDESDLAGTVNAGVPLDPLVESGSFIDATFSNGETPNKFLDRNRNPGKYGEAAEPKHVQRSSDYPPAENTNGWFPITEAAVGGGTESPEKLKLPRGRRKGSESTAGSASSERPDWLPSGWIIEDRVRSSGATAGTKDKYYLEPGSGRRFRSSKEVLYFLETGTLRKKRKVVENSDADVASMEDSGSHKHKSSATRSKSTTLNFDFLEVPEKVEWIFTGSSSACWTPFIGDEKVPESIWKEWAAAFTFLTS
ncbi:Methyl-CpG-binding domain-containing protein [Quillaja saponaria]|uniref:Methyl-CpG-binding domain-containing protein n=1 Tax=Quillaja saponaria TaxID=32244 RepID=A0AAD7PW25_QUISA|nr:Methyl-CpG-binding domain-containing protein [Quillaja saponaria]